MEQPKNDVLRVKRLHVEFQTSHGMVHAVKDVSLEVKRGRIHALVGERWQAWCVIPPFVASNKR